MTEKRKVLTDKQKVIVLERYDGKCAMCHEEAWDFEYDHKIALKKHGGNNLGNWQPLCPPCHKKKTRRDRQDMRKLDRLEAARKALEEGVPKPEKKPKIKNRGFQSWRKFNGEIVSKPQPPKE